MPKVVLIIKDQVSYAPFSYATKTGADVVFMWDAKRCGHVAKFDLEAWRKNDLELAKNLLDNFLPVPILFDVEDDAPTVPVVESTTETVTPAPVAPIFEHPDITPAKVEPVVPEPPKDVLPATKPKIRRLTPEERASAAKEASTGGI